MNSTASSTGNRKPEAESLTPEGGNTSSYPIRTREALAPNESAPMPFQVRRAGRLVDVVGLAPNVVVTAASLGRVRYNREEMQCSLGDYLAMTPYEAKASSYLVFTVTNLGSKTAEGTGQLVVEGEHGPEAAVATPKPADEEIPAGGPFAARRAAAARNPENDAIMEAIIDAAEPANGINRTSTKTRKAVRSTKQIARAKEARVKAATATSGSRSDEKRGASLGSPSGSPKAPLPKPIRPQRVMTRKARRERLGMAALPTTLQTIAPRSDERITILHYGYAEMLHLVFSVGVPISDDARVGIVCALHDAMERGDEPVALQDNEVALRLSLTDHELLAEAVDSRAEFALIDTSVYATAIRHAIDGTQADAGAMVVSSASASDAMTYVAEDATASDADIDNEDVESDALDHELPKPPSSARALASDAVRNVVPIGSRHASDDGRPSDEVVRDRHDGRPER